MLKKLLFAAAASTALLAAAPASAQVYFGADPGGAGVQVGPFGLGVGPRYDHWRGNRWRDHPYGERAYGDYAYGGDCRMVRERVVTPGGRVIFRTHRYC